MKRVFSRKTKKKTQVKLTPREAEQVIRQEFTTEYGNNIRKEFIFKPHSPEDATIKFNIKGNRKEAE